MVVQSVKRNFLIVVSVLILSSVWGCAHRGEVASPKEFPFLDARITGTGFQASEPLQGSLLVRPVKDNRAAYNGQSIDGRRAKNVDAVLGRNMSHEFETVLLRELQKAGIAESTVLSDVPEDSADYVLTIELQALFAEVSGASADSNGIIQFRAHLKRGDKVLLDQAFFQTGNEQERITASGPFSTVRAALDDVMAVAIRKSLLDLFQKIAPSGPSQ